MKRGNSPENAVYFTKWSVYLACTWPPRKFANKWETVKYDVIWIISMISAVCLIVPLAMSMYEYKSDSMIFTQSTCFAGGGANYVVKSILFRFYRKRTQNLIDEMEDFLKNPQPHETIALRRYVDRCSTFHVTITFMNYATTAAVIVTPMFGDAKGFPTFAVYPFAIDSGIVMYLIYLHQSIAGLQFSSGVTIDFQAAVMLWFAGARLEILASEIKHVKRVDDLKNFVRKHQRLLSYARDVTEITRYFALITSWLSGVGTVLSGLQLVGNQPMGEKIQYSPMVIICMINLWICAWPAENLIAVSESMSTAAYNISWIDMSPELMKDLLMVLRISQRPVMISIRGFLPCLSLRFYASFLSAAFSYFTTIRLVMMSDSET